MAAGAKSQVRVPLERALDLPPPFRLVTLREVGDAHEHAIGIAAAEGAGTLVYVGRFDLAEFAVVLEPEEPLAEARRAFHAGMVAVADALIAHAPPERPITFGWPDATYVDGGLVGGGRLAWPGDAQEDEPPAWLVFSAMVRTVGMGDKEPGLVPLGTALDLEGFDGVDSARLVESFARHLMRALNEWRQGGFDTVAKEYLSHLPREPNTLRQLDSRGDLLVRRNGMVDMQPQRRELREALAVPSWLDPGTGAIRA
jgi:hypothetical protein